MMYRMFFLGRDFVSGLLRTLKSRKKTLKTYKLKNFSKKTVLQPYKNKAKIHYTSFPVATPQQVGHFPVASPQQARNINDKSVTSP